MRFFLELPMKLIRMMVRSDTAAPAVRPATSCCVSSLQTVPAVRSRLR